jgi:deoxyadenosine/deoxycytidine kinase
MIISIDGNIGSGKSTLIAELDKFIKFIKLTDYIAVYPEDVNNWSKEGWLQQYYSDMRRFGFGWQTRVLMSIAQLFNTPEYPKKTTNIVERNAETSDQVFIKDMLKNGNLTQIELNTLRQLSNMLINWSPDIIIYINTNPDLCLERIKSRSRDGENTIRIELLESLHINHQEYIENMRSRGIKIHIIDGSQTPQLILANCIQILCEHSSHAFEQCRFLGKQFDS